MRYEVGAGTAVWSCLGMAAVYVGILYCCPSEIRRLPRDHPRHILARFVLISIACALFPAYLYAFYRESDNGISMATKLGFKDDVVETLTTSLSVLVLTMLLFAGSIFSNALEIRCIKKHEKTTWRGAFQQTHLYRMLVIEKMPTMRTLIFGPLTEEFAFRSCMLPLLLDGGWSISTTIFASPLAFGVAHVHHFIDHIRSGRSFKTSLAIVVFQFLYTTVFGIYASFIFLRTGHFFAVFGVHAFCNLMGFPDVSFLSTEHPLHAHQVAILSMYIVGIFAFSALLFALTSVSPPSIFW
ncbi:unnamed protein product [Aphanomyces euteiches]|nr:hypothetical protein Ae201684P_018038 [Aphanomyces euteiches]